jgi:hypothetical protein
MPPEPCENTFLALDPHGFHRVAYYEWGDPREYHAVVCVHGLTRNGRDFDMLATQLAQYCRVVSMDVVGRGASEWLVHKEDYGFPLYLADAATLIALVSQTVKPGPISGFIQRLRGSESELLSTATTERMRNSGPPIGLVEFAGIGHAPG